MHTGPDATARERRQLALMLERIDRFRNGDSAIGDLINDLNALLNELELPDSSWRQEFLRAWGDLEILYAVSLDRESPIPTVGDETVAEDVSHLDMLVRAHLASLDDEDS